MKKPENRGASAPLLAALAAGTALFALTLTAPAYAQSNTPIKIGVIAEATAVAGSSIPQAAQLAADEINAAGGVNGRKIEIVSYDNHSSAAESVRAFQRAATQDHVNAVITSYISEVVLALEPWAGRLKMVTVTPGAASDVITQNIAKDYDHLKYMFHGYATSTSIADATCAAAKDLLVGQLHMKTAVVMSEDAAWTTPLDAEYLKCLPQIGIKVVDHIRFSPDTTDFTPIFNKIEGEKPDVIMTGISHVGVQPTVQWKQQEVPIPMFGVSSQATNSSFWNDTNGATEGVLFQGFSAPDVAVTPKTLPFVQAFASASAIPRPIAGTPPMTRSITSPTQSSAPARSIPTNWSTAMETDRLCRHDRPRPVQGQGHAESARAQDRPRNHQRPDAAMAERQTGQPVAGQGRKRQSEIPVLHQGRRSQLTSAGSTPLALPARSRARGVFAGRR